MGADGLTAFERRRNELIARNLRRMEELQLPGLSSSLTALSGVQSKGRARPSGRDLSRAPKKPRDTPPPRQSARVRGQAADSVFAAGIAHEGAGGLVQLVDGTAMQQGPPEPKVRHPPGPLPFTSENATPVDDAAFLDSLRSIVASPGSSGRGPVRAKDVPRLRLAECDVVKLTREGTTAMAFHTSVAGGLLLAAADKQGNLALWRPEWGSTHGDGGGGGGGGGAKGEDAFSGLVHFKVHDQFISALQWLGPAAPHCLVTASYDGSCRMLDASVGTFTLVGGLPEDVEISAMSATADGSILYIGDNEGGLSRVDTREGAGPVAAAITAHDRKVNCVHVEPGAQTLIATASTDSAVKVWDARTFGGASKSKPLHTFDQRKSCHAAYFAPDGSQRLLSTAFDDTIRVWDVSSTSAPTSSHSVLIKHDNQTGRWVTPFRAVWGPGADWIGVGSMRRGVDVYAADNGKQLATLQSEFMTAIPSRVCAHESLPVLAAATSSGRIHLYRC
ncbi:hypothetical protein FOA52_003219 [Chlamydomonas sp. UWO 241]|nr:hypothetical protein FOA52_003219 [Chlamydomonas sp. UWO 241]